MGTRSAWTSIRIAAAWSIAVLGLVAVSANSDDVRTRMATVLRYAGIQHPAERDVARMAELWTRAQVPGLEREARRLTLRDMFLLYGKLQGYDVTARPQTLDATAQFATSSVEGGGRMDLTLPKPRGKPSGTYLRVDTRGTGPTPLLLIADMGVDGTALYESFAQRQRTAYTMHIVTLPYAGAARPLPWPETVDYAARPWLGQIERELLALIDQPRMKGVTVVGSSGSGYLAARIALLRPKQIRTAVLVHTLVSTPMRDIDNPDAPAPLAQRLLRVKSIPPSPQLFPIAPVPPVEELRRLIADPASTHPTARNWMAFAVKDLAVSRAWTFEALSNGFLVPSLEYSWELMSTDLTEPMKDLAVQVLVMGSRHDKDSPLQNSPNISQWEEITQRYPTIPLTLVTFDDTRAYISADAPEEFDRALADFLAGRPVRGKTRSP